MNKDDLLFLIELYEIYQTGRGPVRTQHYYSLENEGLVKQISGCPFADELAVYEITEKGINLLKKMEF